MLCSILSDYFKIPNFLLLIAFGIILNKITFQGEKIVLFPNEFLAGVSILALIMIVFEGTTKFKLRDVDQLSTQVLKVVMGFIVFNAIFLGAGTFFLFEFNSQNIFYSISLALIFAFVNCGTDPSAVIVALKNSKSKISKILKIESVFNTPFMALLPFIVIDLMINLGSGGLWDQIAMQFVPFIQQFVTGIGAGVLVGLVFFKFMRKKYSDELSSLGVLTAAILTYTLAKNLNGNGVLAVSTLGLYFGNFSIARKDKKEKIQKFSSALATALQILVFVFIGLITKIPLTLDFFVRSFLLFILYLVIRYIVLELVFRKQFRFKEKLFMTFNVAKGIAVATIAFAFTTLYTDPTSIFYQLEGVSLLLNLTLVFMFYSIILATVVAKLKDFFLKKSKE
ncbi:MAG: Na(+)/H(+) antiporter 1 [Candidatus Woesearchaeota archaeon]|nr:Na(+)/H(+) antiporter 1 [Candidatus Woesearchaeota archaeon]